MASEASAGSVDAETTRRATTRARSLTAAMPRLILEARRVAATVIHGLHGRRRAGPGENFWQYRRFVSGEPASRVDWRRSARDDHLYVREREWEAAHTVWIWPDRSPSMMFASPLVSDTKLDRALVMGCAPGRVVQIVDPAEETFPYAGRIEFIEPEGAGAITAGRAEAWRADYERRLDNHRAAIRQETDRLGWTFTIHRTDRPASELLLRLHGQMGAGPKGTGIHRWRALPLSARHV